MKRAGIGSSDAAKSLSAEVVDAMGDTAGAKVRRRVILLCACLPTPATAHTSPFSLLQRVKTENDGDDDEALSQAKAAALDSAASVEPQSTVWLPVNVIDVLKVAVRSIESASHWGPTPSTPPPAARERHPPRTPRALVASGLSDPASAVR